MLAGAADTQRPAFDVVEPFCITCCAGDVCPGQGRGFLLVRGGRSLDISTRYYSDAGIPLINARQAAGLCGVQLRTIYQWVRRKRLEVVGLGEDGEQLFDSSAAAALCPVAA